MAAESLALHRLKGKICECLENCWNRFIGNLLARRVNYSHNNDKDLVCKILNLPKIWSAKDLICQKLNFQDFVCKILNLQNIEFSRFSPQNIELAKIEPYDFVFQILNFQDLSWQILNLSSTEFSRICLLSTSQLLYLWLWAEKDDSLLCRGKQKLCSGETARVPAMWSWLDSGWVPYLCWVCLLILVLRVFFSWFSSFSPSVKTNISKFQFDLERGPSRKLAKTDVAFFLNVVNF